MKEVVGVLGKAYRWEITWAGKAAELENLENEIDEKMGDQWREVKELVAAGRKCEGTEQRALTLLYAHFLRLDINEEALKQGGFRSQAGMTFLIRFHVQNKQSCFCRLRCC
jgi:translocation protein SEC63